MIAAGPRPILGAHVAQAARPSHLPRAVSPVIVYNAVCTLHLSAASSMAGKSNGTGIGQPVQRREDLRMVTGQGCFTDDLSLPGQVHAAVVRSPHAHAIIRSVDKAAALALPGVIAVLTGKDWL